MAQQEIWVLIGLIGAVIPLVAVARRSGVPYPIVLVLAGLALGFVPSLPRIRLDPDVVLFIFLPPLLYWETLNAPTDVMSANAARVWSLAIGLVVATTVTVAAIAHECIPTLGWPMAFVLGATVAPTDELASVPVLERMRIPRHVTAIIEGESLLNDSSALLLYAAAVAAATTGAVNLGWSAWQMLLAGVGGAAVGLIIGRLAIEGWRRVRDTQLQGAIAFVLPFLVYTSAQALGVSGVLAVVMAGIHVNRATPVVMTPATRVQTKGYFDTVVFLVNTVLFLVLGLQLHEVGRAVLTEYSWQEVLGYTVLVNGTVIGTRFAYLMLQGMAPGIGGAAEHEGRPDWKHTLIVAWSGLRGAVSLAAALAIPVTLVDGGLLSHRNLVIFLASTVVFLTLVGGGLTLGPVLRWLQLPEAEGEDEPELERALLAMSKAALQRLDELERDRRIDLEHAIELRGRYQIVRQRFDARAAESARMECEAERSLLAVERTALINLRELREIDNTVLRRLQQLLDLEEERLSRKVDPVAGWTVPSATQADRSRNRTV